MSQSREYCRQQKKIDQAIEKISVVIPMQCCSHLNEKSEQKTIEAKVKNLTLLRCVVTG